MRKDYTRISINDIELIICISRILTSLGLSRYLNILSTFHTVSPQTYVQLVFIVIGTFAGAILLVLPEIHRLILLGIVPCSQLRHAVHIA